MAKSYLSYKNNAKKLLLITHFKTFLKALKNVRRHFDVSNSSFDRAKRDIFHASAFSFNSFFFQLHFTPPKFVPVFISLS